MKERLKATPKTNNNNKKESVDRSIISLLHMSFYLCLCLSLCLSISLSLSLSLSLYLCHSLCLSISVTLCVTLCHTVTSSQMEGVNKVTVVLKDLIEGLYRLKVVVTDKSSSSSPPASGEAFVNVTVLSPKRFNQAPIALINPETLEVKEGNTAILDGSRSRDDDKIETYKWEEVEGPVETQVRESE